MDSTTIDKGKYFYGLLDFLIDKSVKISFFRKIKYWLCRGHDYYSHYTSEYYDKASIGIANPYNAWRFLHIYEIPYRTRYSLVPEKNYINMLLCILTYIGKDNSHYDNYDNTLSILSYIKYNENACIKYLSTELNIGDHIHAVYSLFDLPEEILLHALYNSKRLGTWMKLLERNVYGIANKAALRIINHCEGNNGAESDLQRKAIHEILKSPNVDDVIKLSLKYSDSKALQYQYMQYEKG